MYCPAHGRRKHPKNVREEAKIKLVEMNSDLFLLPVQHQK